MDFGAHRQRAGAQTAVDLQVGVDDRLARAAAHESFHMHLGRHDADRVAALVMIGWMQTVSLSRSSRAGRGSRLSASIAADSALMPSCGAPPAWLARPKKRICLTTAPFELSAI